MSTKNPSHRLRRNKRQRSPRSTGHLRHSAGSLQGFEPLETRIALTAEMNLLGPTGIEIADGDTTPTTTDGTDFGAQDIDTGNLLKFFYIQNIGGSPLNLSPEDTKVLISGPHASDFQIVSRPPSPVATGEFAAFVLRFDPSGVGTRQATLTIPNDDADENPYDFVVQGLGTTTNPTLVPEIEIQGLANNGIFAGDTTPSAQDGTDFGTVNLNSGTSLRSFQITNAGTANLELLGTPSRVTVSGTHASDFVVIQQPTTPLEPGTSSDFQILFDPSGSGLREGTVTITSNDADESPYSFAIAGTASGDSGNAEIELVGVGDTPIVDGDSTPSTADGTDFGTLNIDVGFAFKTYTIRNTGNETLNLTGNPLVTISGPHAIDFAVVATPDAELAPGEESTFSVLFNPSTTGLRQATVEIANSDSDESPYNFAIAGTGTTGTPGAGPEINISGAGISIPDGDVIPNPADGTDFGSNDVTSGVTVRSFSITNSGTSALELTGTPIVAITGPHAADFSVVQIPNSPIASGSNSIFSILFNPTANGQRQATVQVSNTDSDENPYEFAIVGTGTGGSSDPAPEIELLGLGNAVIADGDTTPSELDGTDFGNHDVEGGLGLQSFQINNVGTTLLTLSGNPRVAISGPHAADFSVIFQPPSSVESGTTASFSILFNPTGIGLRQATITIANNDSDEQPFDFAIQGIGISDTPVLAPEMDVTGKDALEIADGKLTPSLADGTDFGEFDITTGTAAQTFSINNSGTSPLTLSGSPRVSITGPQAEDFSIVLEPTSPIAPGSFTTFTVLFNPNGLGVRTATIQISNDDATENPYDFAVQGTGTLPPEPEIDLLGLGDVAIVDGDQTPSVTDGTDFGTLDIDNQLTSVTYTIRNLGDAPLQLGGDPAVVVTGPHADDFEVILQPVSPVAPNSATSFTLLFNPSEEGVRQASVQIVNSDLNETPYDFSIQGFGIRTTPEPLPEIQVSGLNDIIIVDGDTTPDAADGTDFGNVDVVSGITPQAFTITNTGDAVLDLTGDLAVTISGLHADDFLVSQQPSTQLIPGASTSFLLLFDPSEEGVRQATVQIANNDPDESPYDFAIQGTGIRTTPDTFPEIQVSGLNDIIIADGDTTPDAADGTDFGNADVVSGITPQTFTITNTGDGVLDLTGDKAVTISGLQANDFLVTQQPNTQLIPGASTFFTVLFNPSDLGLRQATVEIASNDGDEDPYDFVLQGVGTETPPMPEAEISLRGSNGLLINDGDDTPRPEDGTDFGTLDVIEGLIQRTFTIHNIGSAPLLLTSNPAVTVTGPHAADFDVILQPAQPIAPGGTSTLTVFFNPSAEGLREATLQIPNNDPDETPYTFAVQGVGNQLVTPPQPPIETESTNFLAFGTGTFSSWVPSGNGAFTTLDQSELPDVVTMDYANASSNDAALLRLTYSQPTDWTGIDDDIHFGVQLDTDDRLRIRIIDANGALLHKEFSGLDTSAPTMASVSKSELNSIVTMTQITKVETWFYSAGTGAWFVGGTNTPQPSAPEIDVTGLGGNVIADGETTTSTSAGTDFGSLLASSGTSSVTFTITNSGTSPLELTSSTPVVVTGAAASDFTVTQPIATSIAAGDSTDFTLTFAPSSVGTRSASIGIANTDADENPYDFAISGVGVAAPVVAPEIELRGPGDTQINDGNTTPSSGNGTDYGDQDVDSGAVMQTFTIRNLGTTLLDLEGTPRVAIIGPHASDFTVVSAPDSSVPAGSSTSFTVAFDPSDVGLRQATVQIVNSDANESPYDFAIQGMGTTITPPLPGNPTDFLQYGSTTFSAWVPKGNGSFTTLDQSELPTSVAITYATPSANEAALLRLTYTAPVDWSGMVDGVDFGVQLAGDDRLRVRILDSAGGQVIQEFSALGSDSPVVASLPQSTLTALDLSQISRVETWYYGAGTGTWFVGGPGTPPAPAPEITVRGLAGNTISDGDTSASTTDGTNFGSVDVDAGTTASSFTVHNLGSANLNLSGSPTVVITGPHAADFVVLQQPSANVAAGSSSTFVVQFNPSATGPRQATVQINNNDSNENPYDFVISGSGTTSTSPTTGEATNFNAFGSASFSGWTASGNGAFATVDTSELPSVVALQYATAKATDAALLRMSYRSDADLSGIVDELVFGIQLDADDRLRIRILDDIGGQFLREYTGLSTGTPTTVAIDKSDLDAPLELTQIRRVEAWFYGAGTGIWEVGGN